MGWKGTFRSFNAELKRQARETDRQHKQYLKDVAKLNAINSVHNQNDYFEEIITLHKFCRAKIDWQERPPGEIIDVQKNFKKAKEDLENFHPSFLQRTLKIHNWRRKHLEKKIEEARLLDIQQYYEELRKYQLAKKEWDKKKDFLDRLKEDEGVLIEIIKEYLHIDDLPIGKDVRLEISGNKQVDIYLNVLPIEKVIPEEEFTLRQSGTLSAKKMPKGKALDLYQDHICSALLRIAREVLGTIPWELVRANAVTSAVNTQTGYLEDQVIISAIVPKTTLNNINFDGIDPSNALNNFLHNMRFQKSIGFKAVEKRDFPIQSCQ